MEDVFNEVKLEELIRKIIKEELAIEVVKNTIDNRFDRLEAQMKVVLEGVLRLAEIAKDDEGDAT